MDKIGLKATLYDLVGYIVPGFFLCLGLFIILKGESICCYKKLLELQVSGSFVLIALPSFYAVGHVLASLGSVIFEGKLGRSLISKKYKFDTSLYNARSNCLFGVDYNKCERSAIAYCQEKHPILYDIAFIFLSIYGFSRNLVTVTGILVITYLFKCTVSCGIVSIFIAIIILMFHNYCRFTVLLQ